MTARAAGFNTIHSSPAAGKSETPGSFSELVLLQPTTPNEAGELDARVVLHPNLTGRKPQPNGEIDQMVASGRAVGRQIRTCQRARPLGGPKPNNRRHDPEPPNGPPAAAVSPHLPPPLSSGGGIAPPPNPPQQRRRYRPTPKKPPSSGGGIALPPKAPGMI